jgi:hypothetical protein
MPAKPLHNCARTSSTGNSASVSPRLSVRLCKPRVVAGLSLRQLGKRGGNPAQAKVCWPPLPITKTRGARHGRKSWAWSGCIPVVAIVR